METGATNTSGMKTKTAKKICVRVSPADPAQGTATRKSPPH